MTYAGLERLPVDFAPMLKAVQADTDTKIRLLLEAVGVETIALLRSVTNERRPPVRRGEGERSAHPGHWADITGALANAYAFSVERDPQGGWVLILTNSMAYAAYLEARDGFFVLSGVLEPGGPVDRALRAALAQVAPGWTVA